MNWKLPNPFLNEKGEIADVSAWDIQREYLRDILADDFYGRSPQAPENVTAEKKAEKTLWDGTALFEVYELHFGPESCLSMTTALNRWVPFCGANNKEKRDQLASTGTLDQYVWRASYLPAMNVDSQFTQDPDQDFEMLRWGLREWKQVNPYLLKDFYLLTPWHTEKDVYGFTAYAFLDPETASGVLLAFRQEKCQEDSLSVTLPFASDGQEYTLKDQDTGETLSGSAGTFILRFDRQRQARLLWISASRP